jgi:hypothetical protein
LDTLYVFPIWHMAYGGQSTSHKKYCTNYFRLVLYQICLLQFRKHSLYICATLNTHTRPKSCTQITNQHNTCVMLVRNDRFVKYRGHYILVEGASQPGHTCYKFCIHTCMGDYAIVLKREHANHNSFHTMNEVSRLA